MNPFLKRKLDALVSKIQKKYDRLDEIYEEAHKLENELNVLEDEYNTAAKDVDDVYYKGYMTNGLSLHE